MARKKRMRARRKRGAPVPPATEAETISVQEAAKRLGVGKNQAYAAAHRGEIPTIKIGGRLLVPTAILSRMLQGTA